MRNKVLRDMLIPGCVAVAAIVVPYLLISVGVIDAYTAQIITLGGVVYAIPYWRMFFMSYGC